MSLYKLNSTKENCNYFDLRQRVKIVSASLSSSATLRERLLYIFGHFMILLLTPNADVVEDLRE